MHVPDELKEVVAHLVDALEKIADEDKVYKGHGDYDVVTACSAEEAQSLARTALGNYYAALVLV